jgi:hypothetical protein
MPCGGDGGRLGRWAGQGRSAQRISRAASLLGAVLGLPAEVERDVFKSKSMWERPSASYVGRAGKESAIAHLYLTMWAIWRRMVRPKRLAGGDVRALSVDGKALASAPRVTGETHVMK